MNQLQHRPKWQLQKKDFGEGDVVLLKEAPTYWLLARVVNDHPNFDKKVQSVTINESGKFIESTHSETVSTTNGGERIERK